MAEKYREKMLNIIKYQRNANQNQNDINRTITTKKTALPSADKDAEKNQTPHTLLCDNEKWYSYCEKQSGYFSKN